MVLKEEIPVHMVRRSCKCFFCSSAWALKKLEAHGVKLAKAASMDNRPLHRKLLSQQTLLVQAFLVNSLTSGGMP